VRGGPEALLALEDGTTLRGTGFGASGEAFGEAVFNTGMSGYQEVLTDPSYAGQVVAMTSPHQGNYGTNRADAESARVRVAGFVVREAARRASSWRAERSLAHELAEAGVVGVEGVDTRALTLRIRTRGAMRCGVSTLDLDPGSLVARVRAQPGMEGADLACTVTAPEPYEARALVGPASTDHGPRLRVAAYDFGMKSSILRRLAATGIETTVLPARTRPEEILAGGFDGVFLSNGPGDPAATVYGVEAARGLLGRLPMFGICLGHQLLALALGGRTYKLPFGHRGSNQPVMELATGRVEITSHNHGFAVDPEGWAPADVGSGGAVSAPGTPPPLADGGGWERDLASVVARSRATRPSGAARSGTVPPGGVPVVDTHAGRVALTHWNLNDGTLEGLSCLDATAFAVQFHPEAAPGPHDARHLFQRFRELMVAA
jgi:carbamoyl-phosphate synthase small subunit